MSELIEKSVFSSEQKAYASRVKALLKDRYTYSPKALVITYGCQQNVSDSERLKGMLLLCGYELTEEPDKADFIIYNTCAVREHAQDRVYGNVGAMKHYKRRKPDMLLAVCGCMAQQELVAERFKRSYPYVDMVFGTQVQHRLPEFIYNALSGKRVFENALDNHPIVEEVPISRDGKLKGWLPIMNGCNNFCTYCIVPFVRGAERSRNPEVVLKEAKQMVEAGFKEITLLGQNVNSYGKGDENGVNFAELLRRINAIEGDFRIKFMTSHPKDCTIELLDAIRDCEKVERHLHLPFQSGSDRILKRMNRHYDRKTYLELIKNARERLPDVEFTSDIIVGFPGETYEDFKETLSLVKEVKFASLFTFIYSPRPNTPAASYEDPVSREEKGKWFSELLKTQEDIAKSNIDKMIGREYRILCEGETTANGTMLGHTDFGVAVEFEGAPCCANQLLTVRIEGYNGTLQGKII